MIIKTGETITLGAAKYLNVFSANRAFSISSKDEGLAKTTVKAGFSYDLEGYLLITFHNDGVDDLDIDFEMSTLRVVTGSNAGVEILNNPTIQRIVEPIAVTASATVEDGKMAMNVSNSFAAITDMPIPANGVVKFASARIANNRKVTVQVITDDVTMSKVRVGDKVTLAANQGYFLQGNLDSPAGYEFETETDVYVRNMTANAVTITGGESWR